MRERRWEIGALVCCSGGCALVSQIGWLREFRLIFGASTAASAAVLAIFIGGLGAGGLLLGAYTDRHPRPLLWYARLEAVVGLSSAASPLLLALVRTLYVAIGGTPRLGLVAGTIIRLILSAVVLAIPTMAMGGTLAAAARALGDDEGRDKTGASDTGRRQVAMLYALNTLGAVTGCLAATFVLIEAGGTHRTLWLAATVNLLVAMTARQIDRRRHTHRTTIHAERVERAEDQAGARSTRSEMLTPRARRPKAEPATVSGAAAPAHFILLASGVVGFVFFLMELVWYRMLGPLVGGTVFTLGLILAVALTGIGVGGLWYALVGRARRATLTALTWSCALEATALAIPFALGDRLAVLALMLRPLTRSSFAGSVASWTILTLPIVLPAAVFAGYQFPLLIALVGRGREQLGRQIGAVYASNTIGAIAGSLAGGFGLLPWLSATGAWRVSAIALVALGAAAGALAWGRGARRALLSQTAVAAAACACLFATGPTAVWRHSGIGAGRARVDLTSPNALREWTEAQRRAIVWDEDGTESSVALAMAPSGYTFIVNGKADGGARTDAATQVMFGLLGTLLNPDVRRSLVIGLGTGSTAGWLGAIPSMERVDVVELEPLVVDIARACDEVNRDVLRNPKVEIAIGDAREALLTGRTPYDLIASEPSNPFRAGVASLFTREYYQAASRRLTEHGVFLQWVQLYEVDARTLRTVYATISSVFPHVEAWEAGGGDLVLVAATRPLRYSAAGLAARMQEEPYKTALNVAWRAVDLPGLLAHFVANEHLAPTIAALPGVAINTDDHNLVEFGFARAVGSELPLANLRPMARSAGAARPVFADETSIDWPAVDTAWVAFQAAQLLKTDDPPDPNDVPVDEQARQTALRKYYLSGDLMGAREAWGRQPRKPVGPTELAMLADLEAEAGSDSALDMIDQLRVYQPGEAAVVLATLRFRQARFDEAAGALALAFEYFHTSPWALTRFPERAVALAGAVALQGPHLATRMFDTLDRPLAIRALQDDRLMVEALLSRRVDFTASCRAAIAPLEPHVPWTRSLLTLRSACYRATNDPRQTAAERDLQEFLTLEPAPRTHP